jgi:hypothetical protein
MSPRAAAVLLSLMLSAACLAQTARPIPQRREASQPAKRDAGAQPKDAAKPAEKVDPFVRAEAAYRQKHYAAAIPLLRDFITASVGDSRLADANEMLFDSYRALADRHEKAKASVAAARVLAEGATFFKTGDRADALRDGSKKTLRAAFDAARAADPEAAAEAAADFKRLFPKEPPLADAKQFYQLRIDALAQLVRNKAPAELLWTRTADLLADGVPPDVLAGQKVDVAALEHAYADELLRRKWYARAVELLTDLEQKAPDEREKKKVQSLLAKTLGAYADAALATGNHDLIEEAWAACSAWPGSLNTPGGTKLKRQHAKAAAKAPEPIDVPTDKPLIGDGNLGNAGATIVIRDKLQIGDGKAEGRKDGAVTVPPGALLKGGKIYVEKGKLQLKGEPTRPVIVRGVEISAELGGALLAENTIFVDCKFAKGGGWFYAFYSSQWTFENCTLLRSNFPSLSRSDIGLKTKNCTFIDCNLPQRLLNTPTIEDDDLAARYKDQWNAVDDCDFLLCDVAPSFVWATDKCNFSLCRVTGSDVFLSKSALDVGLYVPKTDAEFWRDLTVNTDSGYAGQLQYSSAPKAFAHKGMTELWPWLPSPAPEKPDEPTKAAAR